MQSHPSRRHPLRRVFGYIRPHRASVVGILVLAVTVAGFNALEPLVLKHVFDGLAGGDAMRAVAAGVIALGVLGLVREGATAVSNWLTWRTRLHVHFSLMEATVSRLHSLPLTFHRSEGVGATMTRLERSIQGFVGAVHEIAFNVLPAVAYLVVAVAVMLQLDWRLALVVLAFAPVPGILAAMAAPKQTRRERTLLERWVGIYGRFNEVLSGIVTVKSFAMEEREKQRFLSSVHDANRIVSRGVGFDSGVTAAQNTTILFARMAALAAGGLLVAQGRITVGTLVAFLGYLGGLFGPVQGLTNIYRVIRTASVSLEEVFRILDAQDYLGDAPDAVELAEVTGDVRFENVHFRYQPDGHSLIDGVDFSVRPGEVVALVGPSGAGKTTLMSLLMRFYDPQSGSVRVDGRDLREVRQASLRRQIGVVHQDALLFNDTVRDNIAYGRPGASNEEVVAAAKAANAHEFILRLPQGYDTPVGERGSRLSAGERQRVAIARALLKDPPILILDEPTSALDAESEALVQQALSRLTRGRTTFAIAHRLSTIVDADRIVVLKDGRIVEQGRHGELIRSSGYYASLVRFQTRGLVAPAA